MARRNHIVLSARDLLALKDEPDRWIIPAMIPKSNRVLVFGEGGHNKTTVTFDLCIAVASGAGFLRQRDGSCVKTQSGPVLINSTEGSIFENKDRLLAHARAQGVNPAELPLYFCQQAFMLDDAVDQQELEGYIKEIKPLIVVLDPLDSFFSGDENSSKDTKPLRMFVNRLVEEYSTTFIIIHHQAKSNPGKPTPRGSSAWYGWADTVLHIKTYQKKLGLPTPTDLVCVEAIKQRNGRAGQVFTAMPYRDEVLKIMTFIYYNDKDPNGIIQEYYKHLIHKMLCTAESPMTNQMVADALSVRQEKIGNALEELEREGLIAKDASVQRAFGLGGDKVREVPAWRALVRMNVVDAAAIMVKAEESEVNEYGIEPQPLGTQLGNPPDDDSLRPAGIPEGSLLPAVLPREDRDSEGPLP